jgi:hypothetical protein
MFLFHINTILIPLLQQCINAALIQQWGIDKDDETQEADYEAAIDAGVKVHHSHITLWRDPPNEAVIRGYEDQLREVPLGRALPDVPLHHLVPDWGSGLGRLWNVFVLSKIAEDLHSAIQDGAWDELIAGFDEVHTYSSPDDLAKRFEKPFYRFAKQYEEQRPINTGNESEDQVNERVREDRITNKDEVSKKRVRLGSRKHTVSTLTNYRNETFLTSEQLANERCFAIPNIEDVSKREALERLFLAMGPNGLQADVQGKRHPAAGLMSDDESDLEKPPTNRAFILLPATWRDQRITTALRYLDTKVPQLRRVRAPGNVARTRNPSADPRHRPSLTPTNSKTTVLGVRKGLPINFYDQRWLNSLIPRDRSRLEEKPAFHWDAANVFR